MNFNWQRFVQDHNIPFVTEGPNVARDHIAIKCPFCGDADPSQHMGLSLKSAKWGCWRSSSHRGILPHRLIQRLLGCTYEVADGFVEGGRELSRFRGLARRLRDKGQRKDQQPSMLKFPTEFRALSDRGIGRMFVGYLEGRGFSRQEVLALSERYGLMYCRQGYWRNRIVFPVFFNMQLVNWTARTISRRNRLRYLTLGDKDGAVRSIKDCLWNYDAVLSGYWKVVALVEGPFDALKLDFYGRRFGLRSVCLFGTGVTKEQRILLDDINEHCDRLFVVADSGAELNRMNLRSELAHLRIKFASVPLGVEDPGDMSRTQVRKFVKTLVS